MRAAAELDAALEDPRRNSRRPRQDRRSSVVRGEADALLSDVRRFPRRTGRGRAGADRRRIEPRPRARRAARRQRPGRRHAGQPAATCRRQPHRAPVGTGSVPSAPTRGRSTARASACTRFPLRRRSRRWSVNIRRRFTKRSPIRWRPTAPARSSGGCWSSPFSPRRVPARTGGDRARRSPPRPQLRNAAGGGNAAALLDRGRGDSDRARRWRCSDGRANPLAGAIAPGGRQSHAAESRLPCPSLRLRRDVQHRPALRRSSRRGRMRASRRRRASSAARGPSSSRSSTSPLMRPRTARARSTPP